MKEYSEFALYYDYLMRHVNYQAWYEYIKTIMLNHVSQTDLIVELGCGTGKFGSKFSNEGFTILGIDQSINMLRVAKTRAYFNFKISCGNIKNFNLAKKADFIFAVHDTMNYFLNYDDLSKVIQNTIQMMHDNSIFMFDVTTEYNISNNFDNKLSKYTIRDTRVEWNNSYDKKNKLIYSYLKFILKDNTEINETHIQRIYSIDEIKSILQKERLEIIGIYGDHSLSEPKDNAVMINFITRMK